MNKKAFTLIELLAVIVILAIIALIAVPIIINIINGTKEKSKEISKDLYLKAVEQAILKKNLKEEFNPSTCTVQKDGNLDCNGTSLTVEVEGEKPCSGTITITKGLVTGENIGYCDGTLVKDSVPFGKDSWDTIVDNVRKGNISKYKVGDTKQVDLGELGVHTLRIANTTRPGECDREGFSQSACGFVIEFADIITTHNMNPTNTNVGGWNASNMREYLNSIEGKPDSGTIYKALTKEIGDIIIDTYVVSGHGSGDSGQNFTSIDKLYLLSPHEVYENGENEDNQMIRDAAWNNTRQLDYYIGITTDDYDGAKKEFNGSATYWWLRSSGSTSINAFFSVRGSGFWDGNSPSLAYGVSPAFRIG